MSTQNEMVDYNEVLRDLTERRDELDTAIRAISRIVGWSMSPTHFAGVSPGAPRQHARPSDSGNGVASPAVSAATIRAALDKSSQ